MSAGPLEGTAVLDLGTVGPGARAVRLLGDLGAAVTRVVAPPGRTIELPFYAYGAMRGVRRVGLDLRHPDAREVALDLAASNTVVVDGFRPGVAERLGVGYEAVRAKRPDIVYCAVTGYGRTGPRARLAGHDLNYQAVCGYLATSGPGPDGPPLPGTTAADAAGGMYAAMAVLAAIVRHERTGTGSYLDVAAIDGMLALMGMQLENHLATSTEIGPGADVLTGAFACYAVYRCADGGFVAVAAIEPAFFRVVCEALGLGDRTAQQYDPDAQDALRAELATAWAARGRDAWIAQLGDADACVSPVLTLSEVVDDVQIAARGHIVTAEHPQHGTLRQLGPMVAGAVRPAEPVALPPTAATESDAVLAAIGYPGSRIDALRRAGVLV